MANPVGGWNFTVSLVDAASAAGTVISVALGGKPVQAGSALSTSITASSRANEKSYEIPDVELPLFRGVELAAVQQHLHAAQAGSRAAVVHALEVHEKTFGRLTCLRDAPAFATHDGSDALAQMAAGARSFHA